MRRALAGLAALALAAAAQAQAPASGPLKIAPPKRVARGETALPQIEAPSNILTQRINADLRRQDRVWLAGRADCLGRGRQSYVERTARVTMAGPMLFAVEVRHDAFCEGAAHPNQFPDVLVYDLATGGRVAWPRLIRGVKQRDPDPSAEWGDVSSLVTWPAAHKAYAAKVHAAMDRETWQGCADLVSQDEGEFYVWPDATKGGLVLEPNWMPHVAQACAESVVFSPADLRRLGADRPLTELFARRQP